MPRDSIFPSSETGFDSFINAAVPHLVSNGARFGINTARRTALTNAAAVWAVAYAKTTDRATRNKNDVSDKNVAKEDLKRLVRETCRALPASVLTPTDRNMLNLRLRDRATPTPVPQSFPFLQVDVGIGLQHTLHYRDSEGLSRAKPKGGASVRNLALHQPRRYAAGTARGLPLPDREPHYALPCTL